jgi:hypothetical protein
MTTRRHLRLLGLCWAGIFMVVTGVDMVTPPTVWGAIPRVVISFTCIPALYWTGFYFLQGPRAARRWWLSFRFVAANWMRVEVIMARGERKNRPVRVGQRAFNDLQKRVEGRQKRGNHETA